MTSDWNLHCALYHLSQKRYIIDVSSGRETARRPGTLAVIGTDKTRCAPHADCVESNDRKMANIGRVDRLSRRENHQLDSNKNPGQKRLIAGIGPLSRGSM